MPHVLNKIKFETKSESIQSMIQYLTCLGPSKLIQVGSLGRSVYAGPTPT